MSDQDFLVQNSSSSSGSENSLQSPVLDEKFLLEEGIYIIKSFNRLFSDVAPISNNFISKNSDKSVEISQNLLSDSQKQVVMELSGHILTMTSVLFERKLHDFHIHDEFSREAIPIKFKEIEKSIDSIKSLQNQAFLLKDYLLREVKCNAELEDKIRNLEEEIVELHANGNSVKTIGKKRRAKSQESIEDDEHSEEEGESSKPHLNSSAFEGVTSSESQNAETSAELSGDEEIQVVSTKTATPKHENTQKQKRKSKGRSGSKNPKKKVKENHQTKWEFPDEPTKFIGQFVRKMFGDSYYFGLIANYDEEWWNIVYEDADSEDMVWEEITTTYWTSLVPREKKERCFRHARNLGTLHDSLLSDGMNTKFLQGPAPSLKNNSSKSANDNTLEDQSKEEENSKMKLDFEIQTERYFGMEIAGEDFAEAEHSSSSSVPLVDLTH